MLMLSWQIWDKGKLQQFVASGRPSCLLEAEEVMKQLHIVVMYADTDRLVVMYVGSRSMAHLKF